MKGNEKNKKNLWITKKTERERGKIHVGDETKYKRMNET
jgi:hypothetical protein